MAFFKSAVDTLQVIVVGVGAVIAVMGMMDFAEGNSEDNGALKNRGGKKIVSGGAIAFIGITLVPQLATLFT